jgi:hypothetical protein
MYNLNVKTIPHDDQRYDTVGDWFMEGGVLQVRVSSMANGDYEFLVAIHELIEKQICRKMGITEQMVDAWDLNHEDAAEPGELEGCPYREAHLIAEGMERTLAVKLGVDWEHYSQTIKSLQQVASPRKIAAEKRHALEVKRYNMREAKRAQRKRIRDGNETATQRTPRSDP